VFITGVSGITRALIIFDYVVTLGSILARISDAIVDVDFAVGPHESGVGAVTSVTV
jgi:hypothetical protein